MPVNAINSSERLVHTSNKGTSAEVMCFKEGKPTWPADSWWERNFRLHPIEIPPHLRSQFEDRRYISYPASGAALKELALFQQAMHLYVATTYPHSGFAFEPLQ